MSQSDLMYMLKTLVGDGNNKNITQHKIKHMDSMSTAAHRKLAMEEEWINMERTKAKLEETKLQTLERSI